jgi:hypothetical protein
VGHDDRAGALEGVVQVRDELAFFRSIHCLSPVDLRPDCSGTEIGLPFADRIIQKRIVRTTLEDPVPFSPLRRFRRRADKRHTRFEPFIEASRFFVGSSPVSCRPI